MIDLFLADAHLRDPADANYRQLLAFLEQQQGRVRTLYLLGDIFEFWVGYRHVVFAPYVPLLEALYRLRQAGTEIVYVEGNHDFHLGPFFARTLGCSILPDGGAVTIDGQRIYLTHGDLIDPADHGYRRLRRLLRSRLVKTLIAIVPPDVTWAISRWGSRRSQARRGGRPSYLPLPLLRRHAQRRFKEGCSAVVSGHFHLPCLETGVGTLVALGDWISQYSYAKLENGVFSLHTWPTD